jgi:outer membrane protein assembly factor BamA
VVRHVANTRVGWLYRPRDGKVAAALSLRSSLFAPDALQPGPAGAALGQTQVLMLEALTVLDLRDRVRSPRRGVFLRAGLQQAGFGGASSWDYLRATLEVRGYVPLGRSLVLAARVAAAGLLMLDTHGVRAPGAHELDELGPLSEQLQAGGISSHRGYRRGGLGASRRSVDAAPADGGSPVPYPVLIAGGTRRWEGSLELRMRVSRKLGAVLFVDAGNVTRRAELELGALNLALGLGVRYRTRLGMLRSEWAFRPEALQRIGPSRGEPRACVDPQDVDCRPTPMLLGRIPGAFHLAFAEPF